MAERVVESLVGGSTRAGWDCSLVRSTIGEPNRSRKPGRPVPYLHALDSAIARRGRGEMIRYAHDVVVLCRMRGAAEAALEPAGETLAGLARKLHPDRTIVVDVKMGREGLDVAGWHFRVRVSDRLLERGTRRRYPGFAQAMPGRASVGRVREDRTHGVERGTGKRATSAPRP